MDTEEEEQLSPLELLVELVGLDVVSIEPCEHILRALLSRPIGTWHDLQTLDPRGVLAAHGKTYTVARENPELLEKVLDGLRYAWTLVADEEDAETSPYCFILIYYGRDDLMMWNRMALFNRDSLKKRALKLVT